MKKTYLVLSLTTTLCLAMTSSVFAYGTNITIFDGKKSTTGIGKGLEDNEAEPGMVQSQAWDLEGFFIEGTTLTMVGGYNFIKGYGGYYSGDIFIDTDGAYGAGSGFIGDDRNYHEYKDNFGYEYVLDVDWDKTNTFNIVKLADNAPTIGAFFADNEEGTPGSNPWRYDDDSPKYDSNSGALIDRGSGASVMNLGFSDWLDDGKGSPHTRYAVSLDLEKFLNDTKLWGTELTFHFTMGCGNDNLMGSASIPEPKTMLLFGTGLVGLGVLGRKKFKK